MPRELSIRVLLQIFQDMNGRTRWPTSSAQLPRVRFLGIFGTASPDPAVAQGEPGPAQNQPAAAQNQPSGEVLPDGAAVVTGFSGAELPTMIAPGVNRPTRPRSISTAPRSGSSTSDRRRAAAGTADRRREAVHRDREPNRSGVCGRARQRDAAEHLRGRDVGVRPADRRAAGGRRRCQSRPARCAERAVHGGSVRTQAQQGGPGSIWRIDGASGAVSLSPMWRSTACRTPARRSVGLRSIRPARACSSLIARPA